MDINRRELLGGLVAVVAAPAIIRPGLLMPIKPALLPSYKLCQIGIDYRATPAEWLDQDTILQRLQDAALERGLVPHHDRLPMPPNADGFYDGDTRFVRYYVTRDDCLMLRADGLFRDYLSA